MDMFKFKLGSKLMKGFLTNLIKKEVNKKLGIDIDLIINDLDISLENGKGHVHIDADADLKGDDVMAIIKQAM